MDKKQPITQEEAIDAEVNVLGKTSEEKAQLKGVFTDVIQKGMTIMDAIKCPPAILELIYSYGIELYNNGKYQDANKLFFYLANMNCRDSRFVFAYAASSHKLKLYQEAATYYLVTAALDPENPLPWFHAGDCYLQLQQYGNALVMAQKAVIVADENPKYVKVKQQADALRYALLKASESVEA